MNATERAHSRYVELHGLSFAYDAAAPYYKTPKRHYHTIGHATAVEKALFLMQHVPGTALVLAARWHDAVYVPGAANGVNEELSALALKNECKPRHLTLTAIALVDTACDYIRQTDIRNHLRRTRVNTEAGFLLDADLSSLAVDYKTFEQNQLSIIREQTGVTPTLSDCKKSAEFLINLATVRRYIYHTDAGRAFFEDDAKRNINRWAAEVKHRG